MSVTPPPPSTHTHCPQRGGAVVAIWCVRLAHHSPPALRPCARTGSNALPHPELTEWHASLTQHHARLASMDKVEPSTLSNPVTKPRAGGQAQRVGGAVPIEWLKGGDRRGFCSLRANASFAPALYPSQRLRGPYRPISVPP